MVGEGAGKGQGRLGKGNKVVFTFLEGIYQKVAIKQNFRQLEVLFRTMQGPLL